MKRRLKENIEIGDRVFVSSDEYQGTVIDINGDEVLVDGPFGEEYHNLNDLEKLGGDYEEDETPNFFKKRFTESKRKNIIRLTESELSRIVRKILKEQDEEKVLKNGTKVLISSPKIEFKQYKMELQADNQKKIKDVIKFIKSKGGDEVGPISSSYMTDKDSNTKIISRTSTFNLPSDFDFNFNGI